MSSRTIAYSGLHGTMRFEAAPPETCPTCAHTAEKSGTLIFTPSDDSLPEQRVTGPLALEFYEYLRHVARRYDIMGPR